MVRSVFYNDGQEHLSTTKHNRFLYITIPRKGKNLGNEGSILPFLGHIKVSQILTVFL